MSDNLNPDQFKQTTVGVEAASDWRMKSSGFDESQIQDYMKRMKSGENVGDVQVEMTGNGPLLTDGHHRLEAARRLGLKRVGAVVYDDSDAGRLGALKRLNEIERQKAAGGTDE